MVCLRAVVKAPDPPVRQAGATITGQVAVWVHVEIEKLL